ncbi:hypothetical protein GGI04_001543 [Coemansia thaxteri]|uniref:DUF4360 domain-containing protein n=1 Tax=Coemansia thaxteri TaxID=2663907 RepID=A0A9W8EEM1_9FUNG|nr:hypothetical protein H4R26_003431 [Coemansia thaxteri]KAJ2007361.1 hypothetical protein GGI04_001543 [Coemansia thaxteri]KAJ2469226.1 hypothetical protein GGI02_003461 [Coemansia sp. RSA 2322]KAJ2478567.1 hypothetical protein EV174_004274 [Coemansia sp. RSA 2320]
MKTGRAALIIAFLASTAGAAMVAVTDVGASKDATVVYTLAQCGDTPCTLINHGMEPTLSASLQDGEASRILLGFTLPPGTTADGIASCQLQMQRPVQGPSEQYTLTASEALGDWDQITVNGITDLPTGKTVGSVQSIGNARPEPIDVTDACKDAADAGNGGAFSLWVDSSGPAVMFPSMKTGAAATLRVFSA